MMEKITVSALAERLGLEKINIGDPDREITAGYVGDLLSWVMGRAPEGGAWITVMTNVNVIAVASLSDVACVILAEGAELDEAALGRAKTEGINVLASSKPAFDLARAL